MERIRTHRRALRTVANLAVALAILAVVGVAAGCFGSSETPPTDPQIREEVAATLDAAKLTGITVDVKDGVVTLGGEVPDQATADRAVGLARTVRGVARVQNELRTAVAAAPTGGPDPAVPPITTPDEVVAARVRLALINNTELAGSSVKTTASGGVVTLTGTVPTDAAKAAAEKTAATTKDVKSVDNQLQVVASQVAVENCPDETVKNDVTTLIDRDYPDYLLTTSVEKGKVTVRGAVKTRAEIVKIGEAIKALKCVKAVNTAFLTVEGGEPDDDRIGSPASGAN